MKRHFWPWVWLVLSAAYFLMPLYATLDFSLQAKRGGLSLVAYANVLDDAKFFESFAFSFQTALVTILISALLIVPTAYWVQLRLPQLRSVIEFFTLLPFVVPAVVLVFSLARTYARTPLTDSRAGLWVLLVGSYVILSFPYMYRAIDTGLRAINIRDLTEAAQSLGAGWPTILLRVIFPNVYLSILSGAFITFAIVMGEFTIASLLAQPTFGPYMNLLSSSKVYEPSALAVVSFALTWGAIAALQWLGQGSRMRLVGLR
jgi:putative spermidine/putrescine transport system permease protein